MKSALRAPDNAIFADKYFGSFKTFINNTLAEFLNRYVTGYLDDIFVYTDTLNQHRVHMRSVLEALSEAGLHLKPEKFEFYGEVRNLGVIIGREGVKMDSDKVAAVQDWLVP